MQVQPLPGFRDFDPASYARRAHIQGVWREVARRYGFEEYDGPPLERLPILRVVGQVGNAYIIAEGPTGMYLIDQHAAHERIVYEELRGQLAKAAVESQLLLDAIAIEPSPAGVFSQM